MKSLAPHLRRLRRRARGLIIAASLLLFPLIVIHVTHSQGGGQTPLPPFKGETGRVLLIPKKTVDAGEIKFKVDTDGDGMPDDDEIGNGTDPNDPADADADMDGDGLTNGDEVAAHTNLNAADTDGDNVSDGDEARLGYNPNDPASRPPADAALASLQITPSPLILGINTIFGPQTLQLRITGVRADNTTFDLTGSSSLTYQSLNQNVLLIDDFGNVGAVAAGTTTVRISSGSVSTDVPVTVTSFTPTAVSSLFIPGYANSVDVVGDFAYVAAGSAGLQVVNVSDRQAPFIAAALDTPGNANDVIVLGGKAYVADGPAGLRVIDVSNPNAPALLGSIETPGYAEDVAVTGARAYVADGPDGLAMVDVSNPAAPTMLGAVDTPGYARGVAVSGQLVAVADGRFDTSKDPGGGFGSLVENNEFGNGLRIVDTSDPAHPQIVGSVEIAFFEAMDVVVRDRVAYVANLFGGLSVIDFSNPMNPRAVNNGGVGVPRGVAIFGRYVMEAEVQFLNVVPVYDVDDPKVLSYRGFLDLSTYGDFNGTGIALDQQYVYLTGSLDSGPATGKSGLTRLMISQYQVQSDPPDTAGVAPTVSITSPQNGETIIEGHEITLSANAADDVGVAAVTFMVNGDAYATDVTAPFSFSIRVPLGINSLTIGATVVDRGGNTGTAAPVLVRVQPNPAPAVSITSPAEGTPLHEGQAIGLTATATDDATVTQVLFNVNGQDLSPLISAPYSQTYLVPSGSANLIIKATATDDLGATASATRTLMVQPDVDAPTITLTSPVQGAEVSETQTITLAAEASDNVRVAAVSFAVNGQPVGGRTEAPYEIGYAVPLDVTQLEIVATAVDGVGQTATASRVISVNRDPSPTVNILAPAEGAQLIEGQPIRLVASAADNGAVDYVTFRVNGNFLGNDFEAPYRQPYVVPTGITSFALEVLARDNLGHETIASRTFQVVPDPGTTVNGRVIDTSAQPLPDATVTVFGQFTAQTAADGSYSIANVPTVRGPILARVTATLDGKPAANASLPKDPVANGVTDLGDTRLSVLPTAPMFANAADYTGDFMPDLIVGYPDRQSRIYQMKEIGELAHGGSSGNGEFLPSVTHELPYGAVSSGATLTDFGFLHKVFTQTVGQPGSVTHLGFQFGEIQSPLPLSTGFAQEAAYMAAGRDNANQPKEVLAFLAASGDTLTVRYRSVEDNTTGVFDISRSLAKGIRAAVAEDDESGDETEFSAAVIVPLNTSAPLRSLKLADVTGDGWLDILAIRQVSGGETKLVVIPRVSDTAFGPPFESAIVARSTSPDKGVDDYSVSATTAGTTPHIYVLGDDRVRVYQTDGTGAFAPETETVLPVGQMPTGTLAGDFNSDGLNDLLVTTRDANAPDSKRLLLYLGTFQGDFEPSTARTYAAPPSAGDTRIVPGQWDGTGSIDVIVVDGEAVIYFRDVGPLNVSN